MTNSRFQILALSGGGFRGLYTAKIIADIEEQIKAPIGSRFDLIVGTSIGGILALALALEIPAKDMVKLFQDHGSEIFKRRALLGFRKSQYSAEGLKRLLERKDLFGEQTLGHCKHPVLVPSINYTTGAPVIFKTPHHKDFFRHQGHRLVDIGLATSAAPAYFPRHCFDNNQFIDGGLFANAPGYIGLHEAEVVFDRAVRDVHLMSVGTMSSKFTVDTRKNRDGGIVDWGGGNPIKMPEKLFGITISAQEALTQRMMEHRLGERYLHVDDVLTDQISKAVGLAKTDRAAQEALLGCASQRSMQLIPQQVFLEFMQHEPSQPVFYHGPNAAT